MSGMTLGLVCFSGVVFALACILAIWEQVRSLDSIDRYPNRSIPLTEEELYEHEQEMIELARIAEEERLAKDRAFVLEETAVEVYGIYADIPLDRETQLFMQQICRTYEVSYAFALAILESESTFDSAAVGDSGKSIGYMQINKPNWNKYGLDAHYDFDNLEIGIRMLSELNEKYGDLDEVIMGYKAGESKMCELVAEGRRLSACDEIPERTLYFQELIESGKVVEWVKVTIN